MCAYSGPVSVCLALWLLSCDLASSFGRKRLPEAALRDGIWPCCKGLGAIIEHRQKLALYNIAPEREARKGDIEQT